MSVNIAIYTQLDFSFGFNIKVKTYKLFFVLNIKLGKGGGFI